MEGSGVAELQGPRLLLPSSPFPLLPSPKQRTTATGKEPSCSSCGVTSNRAHEGESPEAATLRHRAAPTLGSWVKRPCLEGGWPCPAQQPTGVRVGGNPAPYGIYS